MLTRHIRSGIHARPRRGDQTGHGVETQAKARAASGCQELVASQLGGQTSRRRVA